MKKSTLSTLKRIANLSPAFVLRNEKITALTQDRTVCAIYEPEGLVEFEVETPIFNMNEFLSVIDIVGGEDAVIDASEEIISISNGRQKTKYLKSEIEYVKEVPASFEETVESMDVLATFDIDKEIFETITRVGSLLSLNNVKFYSEDGKAKIKIFEEKAESNSHIIELSDCSEDFSSTISLEKFALLGKDEYEISILASVVKFDSKTVEGSLRYFIAPLS